VIFHLGARGSVMALFATCATLGPGLSQRHASSVLWLFSTTFLKIFPSHSVNPTYGSLKWKRTPRVDDIGAAHQGKRVSRVCRTHRECCSDGHRFPAARPFALGTVSNPFHFPPYIANNDDPWSAYALNSHSIAGDKCVEFYPRYL